MRNNDRFLLSTVLASIFVTGCGGGSSEQNTANNPQSMTDLATVEYLSTVLAINDNEAKNYSTTNNANQLIYAGTDVPPVGSVIILNGSAHKILKYGSLQDGKIIVDTGRPNFEEVFERLTVSTKVAVETTQSLVGKERPLFSKAVPSTDIESEILSPMVLSGSIKNGVATVEFDYSRAAGLNKAKILLTGDLTAVAQLRVDVSSGVYKEFLAATPVVIPIPASLGTLQFNLPLGIFVRTESSFKADIARWERSWSVAAGAQYNPSSRSFDNLSSIMETSASESVVDRSTMESALAVLGAVDIKQKTTIASLTIGPQVKPEFVALNGSLGILGVRHEIGVNASVDLVGKFPSLIDCAQIPLSFTQDVYAFLNFGPSKIDDDDDTPILSKLFNYEPIDLEAKIATAQVDIKTFEYGVCKQDPEIHFDTYVDRLGDPITLKVNVSVPDGTPSDKPKPTGSIKFSDSTGVEICLASIQSSGAASCEGALRSMPTTIIAQYGGDGVWPPSSSFVVVKEIPHRYQN